MIRFPRRRDPSIRRRRAFPGAAAWLLPVCALLGCSRGAGESWVALSEHYQPPRLPAEGIAFGTAEVGGELRLRPCSRGKGWWVDWTIPPEAWQPGPAPGLLQVPWPVLPVPGPDDPEESLLQIEVDGEPREKVRWHVALAAGGLEPTKISFLPWALVLGWQEEALPPPASVSTYVALGRRENGVWRVDRPGVSGEGFLLPAGGRAEFRLDLPADAALRMGAVVAGAGIGEHPLRLSVRLDGREVGEYRTETRADGVEAPEIERLSFALGASAKRGAVLSIELEGETGFLALIAPVVAPREPAPRSQRPRRPDLVLFVADTMRADLLEAYRGSPAGPEGSLMPVLDAFAARSTVYSRAFAVAPWTLPSHATMFTGLSPEQHRAVLGESRLTRTAVTLTEALRAAGYRTAATTDGAFLGPTFGLDQGFEWFEFDQHPHTGRTDVFQRTVAHAQGHLAADDGRPLFLFVHSFRLHNPYVWTPEAAERLAPFGRIELTYDELWAADSPVIAEVVAGGPEGEARDTWARRQMEWMYWAGAIDFDGEMAAFLASLEDHGLGENLHLFFTSDHGESFRRLLVHGHATGLEDDQTRIPFIVRSARFAPGRRDLPVDLTDLAPTLAELAGVPFEVRGPGRSLLSSPSARPILQHTAYVRPVLRGVVDWPQRFIAPEEGATTVADLEGDPDERRVRPIDPQQEPDLAQHVRGKIDLHRTWQTRFALEPELAELDAAARAELRRLGYLGGDDD